jgi:rare lipoprotein A
MQGLASWYGGKFQGRLTASGDIFDTNQLTAAHRTLPFGTIVKVINRENGRIVVVRINDRGPFVDNRVIDLSRAAADLIDLTRTGVAPVSLQVMHLPEETTSRVIQIGAFSVQENAYHLVEELRRYELDAEIESNSQNNIYRVVIRNVPVDRLEQTQVRLAEIGYSNVLVRID